MTLANSKITSKEEINITFLQVSLKIKPGKMKEFENKMSAYMKVFYQKSGWELVNAAYHITGNIDRFEHIWRLPAGDNADSVKKMMVAGNDDESYLDIQDCIESTTQELTAAVAYDPSMFGYQRETVVLDCNRAGWVVNNEMLRNNSKPITDATIQTLAAEGALTAKLSGNRELLFNLAQIASKSCFQWPSSLGDQARAKKTPPPPQFPSGIHQFHVLTPWGTEYCFDQTNLKNNAEYLSPKEIATRPRLQPILNSNVSLASIPEPKDDIPGTGCMCYVINLASFE